MAGDDIKYDFGGIITSPRCPTTGRARYLCDPFRKR
jgi:hypothetical protein